MFCYPWKSPGVWDRLNLALVCENHRIRRFRFSHHKTASAENPLGEIRPGVREEPTNADIYPHPPLPRPGPAKTKGAPISSFPWDKTIKKSDGVT